MITLNRIIMHRIDKTQHVTNAVARYKSSIFSVSNTLTEFADSLHETYNRKTSKQYANFYEGENTPTFQLNLDEYLVNPSDETFYSFSRKVTELLSNKMNDRTASTGGFVVIATYTTEHHNEFILIALLNKKEGYTEDNLDIVKIEQLNLDQLGMAGFVNITNYQNKDSSFRPLSFMKGTREVTDYFANFLGADQNIETSAHMTELFVKVLNDYFTHKEYDANRRELLNQSVYTFCEERRKNKEEVNLEAISSLLDPNEPEEFFQFSQNEENNYGLNTIIESINKQELNKLKSFSYKGDGFRLTFNKELYNNSIRLDRNNRLIISNLSEEFISEIRQECEIS